MTFKGAKRLPNVVQMPSQVSSDVGFFDRFAGWAAGLASLTPFFAFCLLLVLIWLIQGAAVVVASRSFSKFFDATYQREISTTATVITFLMVALLQNSQTRENQATQHKLNAIADGIRAHHATRSRMPGSQIRRTQSSHQAVAALAY